ncbi:MAG: glycerol-3-phosphate 1-O-acyltransferase PlsY [Dehalococcoidales bacterium]|nr:glycerol-3-phosphate 1-O-acyltransferase PlsY [Dehalococcoidales bacterium]
MIIKYLIVVLVGYLLGSIPFGLIIGKRHARVDIRQVGSGKTGMTNVLRVAGKKAAVLVLILDLLKGAAAVTFAGFLFRSEWLVVGDTTLWWMGRSAQAAGGLAAMSGHVWPVFLKFKGGRGVATFFGGLAALYPPAAIFGGEVLFIGAGLTKYMSVGSIAGAVGTYAILAPLTIMHGFPIEYLFYGLAGIIVIIFMHRDNISRLLSGKERKLGEKVEIEKAPAKPN